MRSRLPHGAQRRLWLALHTKHFFSPFLLSLVLMKDNQLITHHCYLSLSQSIHIVAMTTIINLCFLDASVHIHCKVQLNLKEVQRLVNSRKYVLTEKTRH